MAMSDPYRYQYHPDEPLQAYRPRDLIAGSPPPHLPPPPGSYHSPSPSSYGSPSVVRYQLEPYSLPPTSDPRPRLDHLPHLSPPFLRKREREEWYEPSSPRHPHPTTVTSSSYNPPHSPFPPHRPPPSSSSYNRPHPAVSSGRSSEWSSPSPSSSSYPPPPPSFLDEGPPPPSISSTFLSRGRVVLPPNRVLLLTVHRCRFPVSVSDFHSIFAPFGSISRILVWHRSGDSTKALIQLQSLSAAVAAHAALQGRDIFEGSNTVEVEFSGLRELLIRKESERARDYTRGSGPLGERQREREGDTQELRRDGQRDSRDRGSSLASSYPIPSPPPHSRSSVASSLSPSPVSVPGRVLFASNLCPIHVTIDHLVALFSTYGNVTRLKLLFRSRGAALIQMETAAQADAALTHLRSIPLKGRALSLSSSHHGEIAFSIEPDRSELYRDLTPPHPSHRFKQRFDPTGLHPPSSALLISDLPPSACEDEVKAAFNAHGRVLHCEVVGEGGEKVARVRLSSVEEAVMGLVEVRTIAGAGVKIAFTDDSRGREEGKGGSGGEAVAEAAVKRAPGVEEGEAQKVEAAVQGRIEGKAAPQSILPPL